MACHCFQTTNAQQKIEWLVVKDVLSFPSDALWKTLSNTIFQHLFHLSATATTFNKISKLKFTFFSPSPPGLQSLLCCPF